MRRGESQALKFTLGTRSHRHSGLGRLQRSGAPSQGASCKLMQAQPGLPPTLLQAQLPGTLLHGLAKAVGRSGLLLLLLLRATAAPVSSAAGRLGAAEQDTKLSRTLTEKSLIIALLRPPACSLPPLLMHQAVGPRES